MHMLRQHGIRESVHRSILAGIADEELTTLRFTSAGFDELIFKDDGRELEWAGAMYDIISVEPAGDMVIVTALRDDEETILERGFGRLVRVKVELGAGEEEESSGSISPWSPFHEAWSGVCLGMVPYAERHFRTMSGLMGRDRGAIDPGPPRGA